MDTPGQDSGWEVRGGDFVLREILCEAKENGKEKTENEVTWFASGPGRRKSPYEILFLIERSTFRSTCPLVQWRFDVLLEFPSAGIFPDC